MPNAPCPVVSRLTVSRLPRGHVFGYPCDAASAAAYGRLPEWPKGAVCKTVGSAYVGSNPTPATTCGNGPLAADTRQAGRFLLVTPCIVVRRAAPKSGQVAEAVLAEVRRKSLPEPNIDFAVATLARVAGMVPGAGDAVFAVARTAGWIAHALEAYAGGGPLRPRAVYTGPPAIIDP